MTYGSGVYGAGIYGASSVDDWPIVAEILPDDGAPQVGVTVTGLVGEQVIDVETSWDGGESWHPVRGGMGREASGGAFIRDHFPALNLPILYRATVRGTGEVMVTEEPLTVPSEHMYLQDPLAPRDAVQVECEIDEGRVLVVGSFAAAQYRQSVELTQVFGASAPVAAISQRMVASDVPLVVTYDVANEGGMFRRLLMNAQQLVLRGHHFDLLAPVASIVLGDATELRTIEFVNPPRQVSEWQLSATQARPVNLAFVIPWWTYAQVESAWQGRSYADVQGARPGATYLDWQRDPVEAS